VVVIDVFFGHAARSVVNDVDVSAVVSVFSDERIRDCGVLACVGIDVLKRGFVEHEFRVDDGAVKHRDGHVDRLSCEHISRFVGEREVCVARLFNHILDILVDCHVFFLAVFVDVLIYVTAECVFNADYRVDYKCGVALAALDECVDSRPVEVRLKHVFVHSAEHCRDVEFGGQITRIGVKERIHDD